MMDLDHLSFELERFDWQGEPVGIRGRWYGVARPRFVRPTLHVRVRPAAAAGACSPCWTTNPGRPTKTASGSPPSSGEARSRRLTPPASKSPRSRPRPPRPVRSRRAPRSPREPAQRPASPNRPPPRRRRTTPPAPAAKRNSRSSAAVPPPTPRRRRSLPPWSAPPRRSPPAARARCRRVAEPHRRAAPRLPSSRRCGPACGGGRARDPCLSRGPM